MRISRWAITHQLCYAIAAVGSILAMEVIQYWPIIKALWNDLCGRH